MSEAFVSVLNSSIAAVWGIAAVIILRLLLKKVPRKYICFLWALVAIRLVLPFSFESALSLIPSAHTFQIVESRETSVFMDDTEKNRDEAGTADDAEVSKEGPVISEDAEGYKEYQELGEDMTNGLYVGMENGTSSKTGEQVLQINSGFAAIDEVTNRYLSRQPVRINTGAGTKLHSSAAEPEKNHQVWDLVAVLPYVWTAGVVILFAGALISYGKLHRKVRISIKRDDGSYACDKISTPFILGVLSPKIYLPYSLDRDSVQYVLAHEKAHLQRKDHWWKVLGYVLLAIHWFNPLVWVGYVLFCKDIEFACDERVIAHRDSEYKKAYAMTLLSCSVPGIHIVTAPIGFGEINVKERIIAVMHEKKPSFWISVLTIFMGIILVVCFLTGPKQKSGLENALGPSDNVGQNTSPDSPAEADTEHVSDGAQTETREVFDSYHTLYEFSCKNWTDQLIAEGKIQKEDQLIGALILQDREQTLPEIRDYRGDFLAFGEDGNVKIYRSDMKVEYSEKDGKERFVLLEETDFELSEIHNKKEAMETEPVFLNVYVDDVYIFDRVADYLKANHDKMYQKLLQPDTALEYFMHLEDGKAEWLPVSMYEALVTFTFDNGDTIHVVMQRMAGMDIWQPGFLLEKYPEWCDRYISSIYEMNKILQNVTASSLQEETLTAEELIRSNDGNFVNTRSGFAILNALSKDVVLYGTWQANDPTTRAMVLRVEDEVYPIYVDWENMRRAMPELYKADFDGDGDEEYAIILVNKTGTGFSGEALYLLDIENGTPSVYEFAERDWLRQVEEGMEYQYVEEYNSLRFSYPDGKYLYFYQLEEDSFERLVLGDIQEFEIKNDRIYFDVYGGVISKEAAHPQYESGIEFLCPVTYEGKGRFILGKLAANRREPGNINDLEDTVYTRDLKSVSADLSQNGIADTISIGVEYTLEDEKLTTEELLKKGHCLRVRVENDGNPDGCTFERRISLERFDGNVLALYLVHDKGKDYLMDLRSCLWQGNGELEYKVFLLGEDGTKYPLEEDILYLNYNEPDPEMPTEEIKAFTQKLQAWLDKGELLVMADEEYGIRLYGNGAGLTVEEIWVRFE